MSYRTTKRQLNRATRISTPEKTMTDEMFEDPFKPSPLPGASPAAGEPPTNGRKKRGPRRGQVASEASAKPKGKRGRKPKSAPAVGGQAAHPPSPANGGLDLARIVGATVGLAQDEAQFIISVVTALQGRSKKSRAKIVAAFGRIF